MSISIRSGGPRLRRPLRALTLTAIGALGATTVVVPEAAAAVPRQVLPATVTAGAADDGSVDELDQALATAASTGTATEVLSARTEISDQWANPDGTFSVKRYGAPIRLFRAGAWVKTDPSLVFAADGGVVPKAAAVSVVFSGGGTGPLLSGVKDGRTLTLSWPKPLPKPVLAANIATYSEILPGVDLQLKAEVEGFSQLLVVKSAAAAANPDLATLKYTMSTVGLSVSTDADTGSVTALDPAGQTVFSSPTPLMWDSTSTTSAPSAAPASVTARTVTTATTAEVPAGGEAFEPSPGANDAQMATAVSGNTLSITPDQALLTAPSTQYPVFIDPSWAWGNRQNWTRVYKKYPKSSYWNANEVARVGYENQTGGLSRSFFQMNTANIKGAGVISSTFRILNKWSWSCQARPVELWETKAISKKTTWSNQPDRVAKLYTVNAAKGWQGSDNCPADNLEFDTTANVRAAAATNKASITLGLYASDETDTFGWKKFDPKTAVLETKYNHPPKTPTGLGTNPKTDCATGGGIGNTSISLHATIDDPDAGNLTAQFQLYKAGVATPVLDQSIPALRGKIATLILPDNKADNGDFTWRVRAKDNQGEYSPAWSATCKFTVDRQRPLYPVISSTVFPNGEAGWPAGTGKARTAGGFSLTANGVPDVKRYGWYSDDDPQVKYTDATPGAATSISITPPGYGPHFVYAFSLDKVGNRSDTATYVYYAGRSTERDIPGDLNGDGNNDIWNIDSNGTLLTYAGQGNGQFSAATNGGQAFASGQVTSRGDWGQDGYNDLIALTTNPNEPAKEIRYYPNNGVGLVADDYKTFTVFCPKKDNTNGCDGDEAWTGDDHWHDAEQIIAPGDLNGDGAPDVLVKEGKLLWVYYGTRDNPNLDNNGAPVLVGGSDWDKFTVIAPGDLNGDSIPDLLLREDATGSIYRSYGKNGPDGKLDPTTWGDPASRVQIKNTAGKNLAISAGACPAIGSAGDITGDTIPDLWCRKTDNTMTGWPGVKTGANVTDFGAPFTIDGITGGSRIPAGTTLTSGQSFTSRSAKLSMQSDGNLVITSNAGKTLWSAGTAGTGAKTLMQNDGNLVVYKADGITKAWESKTSAPGGYALLQDRGNLIVYNVKGQSLWSSGTAIRHDYNGDGRSDMAALYSYADGHYNLHTFKANSDGTFANPAMSYSAPAGSGNAANMTYATGDYNGDGRGDMAMLYNYADGHVRLFTATGNAEGGFNTPVASWSAAPGRWWANQMSLQSGDFNSDGRDDLAVWYDYSDGHDTLFTFTANPQGGFNEPFASWTTSPGNWDVTHAKFAIGDYNGDGRDDIGVLYGYGDMTTVKMHTFLANPTGGFNDPTISWTSATWGSWNQAHLQAGDFNGDGRDDIAAWYDHSNGQDSLNTFLSTSKPDGSFNPPFTAWSTPAGNYYYDSMPQMVAGDYNGDGKDDLGVMYGYSNATSRMITWTAKPDGSGTFNDPTLSAWTSATNTWQNKDVHFFNTHS
ncbi:FG-GAP-like repeat-containing protein [Streptomyces sp. H39-C1]|uniref:FG-GAP-like repeat-containing protein n=1 Tax=Streptomyces sp. H39-C1 TaxID=3004355 RepID=UPI0022AF4C63|nr:FG-GAP-like repeat-containing protein [Streptomyces sp. H39-C1]MCZ4097129.1 FG-GAP-like repeat-containing protein [Streptomyces sp. H39-C1]